MMRLPQYRIQVRKVSARPSRWIWIITKADDGSVLHGSEKQYESAGKALVAAAVMRKRLIQRPAAPTLRIALANQVAD